MSGVPPGESKPRPLVLASTSRYRRSLLARLELAFEVAAPRLDERAFDARFAELDDDAFAMMLADAKAQSVAKRHPDAWILAADQIATVAGPPRRLLNKPETEARAIEMLMELSGTTHVLTTAVVLQNAAFGVRHQAVDRQRLTMRRFGRDEAERYVQNARPLDCVGAYRIEDAGILLFERVEGDDITGIIGLPLLLVAGLLRRVGLLPGP